MVNIKETFSNIMDRFRGNTAKKEQYNQFATGQEWLRNLMATGGISQGFLSDIYNEETLTPHVEMRECVEMYQTNSFIVTGVEALRDILLGRDVRFVSEDTETEKYFNKWGETSDFFRYLPEAVENYIKVGNGYLEPLMGEKSGLPRKWLPVPRACWIWCQREINQKVEMVKGNVKKKNIEQIHYWEEVPSYYRDTNAQRIVVSYDRWSTQQHSIRAVDLGYNLLHIRWGVGHVPMYGRSPLASSVSDGKVLREIERAMAVIARYKAIPRKVITVNPPQGSVQSTTSLDRIIQYWNGMSDLESPIFKNVDMNIQDLSYAGQEPQFQAIVDYLKTKITSTLIPSYYIHGDVTRYAVALEQKNEFNLVCESRRKDISNTIDDFLQWYVTKFNKTPDELRKPSEMGLQLSSDIYIEFGDFDFPTRRELVSEATLQWNAGGITLDEYREALGLDPVGGDLGDAFKHELTSLGPPGQGVPVSPRDISPFEADKNDRGKK